jgi:hypothetical protein
MALIPRALRPAAIVRRKAMYDGIFGSSTLWKAVAVVVFGKSTLKRFFGKNEEVLDVITLKGGGRVVGVETIRPAHAATAAPGGPRRQARPGGLTRCSSGSASRAGRSPSTDSARSTNSSTSSA